MGAAPGSDDDAAMEELRLSPFGRGAGAHDSAGPRLNRSDSRNSFGVPALDEGGHLGGDADDFGAELADAAAAAASSHQLIPAAGDTPMGFAGAARAAGGLGLTSFSGIGGFAGGPGGAASGGAAGGLAGLGGGFGPGAGTVSDAPPLRSSSAGGASDRQGRIGSRLLNRRGSGIGPVVDTRAGRLGSLGAEAASTPTADPGRGTLMARYWQSQAARARSPALGRSQSGGSTLADGENGTAGVLSGLMHSSPQAEAAAKARSRRRSKSALAKSEAAMQKRRRVTAALRTVALLRMRFSKPSGTSGSARTPRASAKQASAGPPRIPAGSLVRVRVPELAPATRTYRLCLVFRHLQREGSALGSSSEAQTVMRLRGAQPAAGAASNAEAAGSPAGASPGVQGSPRPLSVRLPAEGRKLKALAGFSPLGLVRRAELRYRLLDVEHRVPVRVSGRRLSQNGVVAVAQLRSHVFAATPDSFLTMLASQAMAIHLVAVKRVGEPSPKR
ncbi:hypothetical protein FNF28_01961 [Cafeteria roenbergensis]|uniref:Uncharacterized protein n=1 Tax=Cafeteria roenbergensis TaxID=33653 RepID=A0A5A8DW28_CAFRO|nr:hypothetical protein FNF28_01961 [Cafeteria roenbergensis]